MDVTSANFAEAMARLEAVLPGCAFVAFDEEMTGIQLNASTVPAFGDTPEQRYAKMRRVATEFTLMQVGICVFTAEDDAFVAHPFNFYVCPDANSGARLVMHVSPPAAARAAIVVAAAAAARHARPRLLRTGVDRRVPPREQVRLQQVALPRHPVPHDRGVRAFARQRARESRGGGQEGGG